MRKNIFTFVFIFVITAFFAGNITFAQTETESEEVLLKRAQLNAELLQIEKEIEKERVVLSEKQREAVSLSRDVAILNANIKKAQLGIRARDLTIEELHEDIGEKGEFIGVLNEKTDREKQSLSQLLRKTNEIESTSLVEIMLGNQNLSDFFIDLDSFESINQALDASFKEIKAVKNATETEVKKLEEEKDEEVNLLLLQEAEKRRITQDEAEKQRILAVTKGEEKVYQKIIKEKEKTAAEIRTALFALRGSSAISFGRAYELAKLAEEQTGVRPAFLLGIITQETRLGENIGNCNLPDDPPKYKWQSIMKSPRDTVPYIDITTRLGLDPELMPLSCAQAGGYGGAMGPAQFIPSTWVLYESQISELTGNNPPNPWNTEDAFMASAILLRDNGAAKGGYAAERLAALRYFAGWKNAEKPANAPYGDGVMSLAAGHQKSIDILEAE
ncbi:MAG: lytic murein transglycosylase [Candidatus Pacebacteria bacterium]|nr:lytic murein transglycosylase [Candidatus Paceibacterota bacterium]